MSYDYSKPMVSKGTIYKMLGWKRHTKHSLYGHYFVNDKCIDCGLTKAKFSKRFTHNS